MIYELIQPSDLITFETDDEQSLIAGILMLFRNGMIGLENIEEDGHVVPLFYFWEEKSIESWLLSRFPDGFNSYMADDSNMVKMADSLGSILYTRDRELFDDAIKNMGKEEAWEYRKKYNDKHRTSMTDYSMMVMSYAEKLWKNYSEK